MDICAQKTLATYQSDEGAAAFIAKERKHEDNRNTWYYVGWDTWALQGVRVLDVGCGYGRDVAEFRRRGAEAYGCDASGPLLAQAEQDAGPYFRNYDVLSGEPLPFGGDFDLIWCCAVLVHIPRSELAGVLERMWQGIKVGGRLVIVTKGGVGEDMVYNLGENLPRLMVFYDSGEITSVLTGFGGVVEVENPEYSATAYGESLLFVQMRNV